MMTLVFVVMCFQAMEGYGTQESSEQNNTELETKMEVARQSLRRAEVTCVCVILFLNVAPVLPLVVKQMK